MTIRIVKAWIIKCSYRCPTLFSTHILTKIGFHTLRVHKIDFVFIHKNINNISKIVIIENQYQYLTRRLRKKVYEKMSDKNNNIVLYVNNLKKHFDTVKAVDGISFTVRKGEIYGLLGPNGAGKTTAIKNIIGLLDPDEGEIELLGVNPFESGVNENSVKAQIGYVSEEPLLYKSLTPRELFNFIISVRQLDPNETYRVLNNLLESFEAKQYYNSPIITLSKGNKPENANHCSPCARSGITYYG